VDGLRVQEVRHAVSRRAIRSCISVWRTVAERLARDLYSLRGDRVLRARDSDGKDHYFNRFEELKQRGSDEIADDALTPEWRRRGNWSPRNTSAQPASCENRSLTPALSVLIASFVAVPYPRHRSQPERPLTAGEARHGPESRVSIFGDPAETANRRPQGEIEAVCTIVGGCAQLNRHR
jgi:hypothetical protein